MGVARLAVDGNWESVLNKHAKTALERVLPDFLRAQRWFGGKARPVQLASIDDAVPIPYDSTVAHVALVRVHYAQGAPETYALPLAFVPEPEAARVETENPQSVVARLSAQGREGVLVTPMREHGFRHALLGAIGSGKSFKSDSGGEIRGVPTSAFGRLTGGDASRLEPSLMRAEQSNSSILYGDRVILKLFRRLSEGINPDLEVGAFLTAAGFAHIPPVGGALEYRSEKGEPATLGILQGFVRNEGDAWSFTLDALSRYYERVAQASEPRPEAMELIGPYLDAAGLLGKRTAELHLVLASNSENPAFAPEPFSASYQRSFYESVRNLAAQSFQLLARRLESLPEGLREEAARVQSLEPRVLERFRSVQELKVTALRTRVHGDYHLGQVLYRGRDFVIIDFEGEPARPISERRIKRSPLVDVAGMLRSFHYAAFGALMNRSAQAGPGPHDALLLEAAAGHWYSTVASVFVTKYLEAAGSASFLPAGKEELVSLLETYQLEKAVYEMAYELNNRPDWLGIPLQGILRILEDPQ